MNDQSSIEKEIRSRMVHFYGQTDGTMRFPNSAEGDLLKMTFNLLNAMNSPLAKVTNTLQDAAKAVTALDVIAKILRTTPDWSADTLDAIAEVVINTGRSIEEPDTAPKETDYPDEERHPKDLREGDRVHWVSQWAKKDTAGRMITYHGTLIDRAVTMPGWNVRRDDGRKVKIRSTLLRREPGRDTTEVEAIVAELRALPEDEPLTDEQAANLLALALPEDESLAPFDAGHPITWPDEPEQSKPQLWLAFYLGTDSETIFPHETAIDVEVHPDAAWLKSRITGALEVAHVRAVVIPGDPLDTDGLAAAAKYAGPGETLLNVFEYPLTQITRQ